MERYFFFLGYVWRVFTNLLALLIVLYVFSQLNQRLEFITVSILGLMYGTIRAIAFNQGSAFARVVMAFARDVHSIRGALGIEQNDSDDEEAEKQLNRQIVKGYIDMAFLSLISLACLYHLFSAL